MKNYYEMKSFTLKDIPNLDTCVLGALELLNREKVPKINIPYKHPLVVGSGNAEATGKILFHDKDAIFANESNLKTKIKTKGIDGIVIISASGSKHAPIIAKKAKQHKKHITLITTKDHSQTEKYLDKKHSHDEFIFPRQREPYTYNTSTYLGMILGKTKENPKEIYNFIKNKIDKLNLSKLRTYKRFYLIIPPKFSLIKRMFEVKFIELFGREIARDIETSEYIKHATTVIPSKELFISFGEKNTHYGKKENRLYIPLPKKADFGTIIAIGYYIIGKIQSHNPYFKKNIEKYTKEASKVFNTRIGPIVE